jgi:acyl dehydratase
MSAQPLISLPGLLLRAVATLQRRPQGILPLQALECHFEVAGIAMAHVARYRQLFAAQGSHVPLTYFYLLAQRAQIALMLDARFPHAIPGLIHTRNDMRLHDIPQAGTGLAMHVSVMPSQVVGDVPRMVFSVNITACGRHVASCISEYQVRRKRCGKRAQTYETEKLPELFSTMDWAVEQSHIRRYAMVSGDCNPIHLSALLARPFGYRRAIAHGMYSVGRAVASIERQTGRQVVAITADFRRPVHLPAHLIFGFESAATTPGNYGLLLADRRRVALSGVFELAS